MWGKTQFTAEEVAASRRISAARIHVERTIGYIENYRILRNKVAHAMLPYLSDVFFICSQLTNLQPVFLREVDENYSKAPSYFKLSKVL